MKKSNFFGVILTLVCANLMGFTNLAAQSLQNITSISADFTQEIRGDVAENGNNGSIKYSGSLVARADSKAYWRYESPMKKEIFVDKKRIMIYEPEFEQVIVSDKVDLDFVAILNAVQKKGDSQWESVVNNQKFIITMQGDKPHKISYKDELDNEVVITLKRVVLNQKFSDEVFVFRMPSSVEVIYQ